MDRFDLGTYTKTITTRSRDAQKYFNLGLNWCYGFNHEEGVACFRKALAYDPDCVMAYWGIAYGSGPFYNNLWRQHSTAEAETTTRICFDALKSARARITEQTSPLEVELVEALGQRFQKPHAVGLDEFDRWDTDYADAMRAVYADHPDDHDVMALFAEAVMTRTAWRLWNVQTGEPTPGANTLEALGAIERSIALTDAANVKPHPAILHLHIHATEMSHNPEQALRSAERLGALCPDAGHLNHMPAHTFALCGEFDRAKAASERAIRADDLYVEYAGPYNFYTTARCHDLHMMMYVCMFLGQLQPALNAAEQIVQTLSKSVLSIPDRPQTTTTMEGYYSMRVHVLVRFGLWQQIIDEPMADDPDLYFVTIPMQHYAKGIAQAALGNPIAADAERDHFHAALRRIPAERVIFNNPAQEILGVAEMMLEGELAYHRGDYDAAFTALREAVRRNDQLIYSEPWPWMHPPRHALAALLSAQGQYAEAEDVCRTDLGLNGKIPRCSRHPNNIWALTGLVECLEARGDMEELPRFSELLHIAQSKAETMITSPCMCRAASVV